MVLVCATVKISSDGTMSDVKILNTFNVLLVPEEAMYLIESSFKEFLISLRK